MNRRFLIGALCLLAPLSNLAQNVNGEASFVSFSIPGALGTYPMSINSSMTVTGYYYVSPTQTRGFVREADGSIENFAIAGGVWTAPESINVNGDITGFYELTIGVPQGFLRYADGRIVTFDLPASEPLVPAEAQPVSINDFDEIAGNYPDPLVSAAVFMRSSAGAFTTFAFQQGAAYGTEVTAINDSGTIVGYSRNGPTVGFSRHPDGFLTQVLVPPPAGQSYCDNSITIPDNINAEGTIAGWYSTKLMDSHCVTSIQGGFVLSPDGVYTLFNPPGTIVSSSLPPVFVFDQQSLTVPHWISINQAGDIAGSYKDANGVQHGFVRNPYGTITSFDPPEGNQTTSTAINDGGAITGFYHYSAGSGPPVGFIRVP